VGMVEAPALWEGPEDLGSQQGMADHGIDRNSSYRAFPEAQQRMLRLGWERGWDESSMALRSIREAAEA
jgi:hypothetical protein